jgi:hypothetical protein
MSFGDDGVRVSARADMRPRIYPNVQAGPFLHPPGGAQDRPAVRHFGDLHAEHELHPVQPLRQRRRLGGLHDQPGGGAVVDDPRVELNAPLNAEQQQLARLGGGKVGDLLRGQGVEPAQPVGTGNGHHAAVRKVDDGGSGCQRALLPQRLTVVRSDAGVSATGLDRARARQQGALDSHMK